MLILQKTIAERAGVSYATVSRAFTNSAKVKPQTLQRIRNAMRELGIADSDDVLLGREFVSKAVLLIVSDVSNHFYAKVVRGICDGLEPSGYRVVLCNSGSDADRELTAMEYAEDNRFSGIIMSTVADPERTARFLQSASLPAVLVNRYIPSLDLDVVRIDNYRGGYTAAEHLLEHRHRRIAMLAGIHGSATATDRARGFRDAMESHGRSLAPEDIQYGDNTWESGYSYADWLLSRPARYTAVFVGNDYMAAGMVRRLLEKGRRVPEDYSVVCFDDSYLVNEQGLNVTSINCDPMLMGRSAAELFLHRRGDLLGERSRVIYSPRLCVRASVASL